MPRFAAAIALACLAGCSLMTSSEVVTIGKRHEYASSQGARPAAACIARNGRNAGDLYVTTLSELRAQDTFEVSIAATGLSQGAIVVVHTGPLGAGSRLEFFISPRMMDSAESVWIERLRKGC